jgi:hypothetical protein
MGYRPGIRYSGRGRGGKGAIAVKILSVLAFFRLSGWRLMLRLLAANLLAIGLIGPAAWLAGNASGLAATKALPTPSVRAGTAQLLAADPSQPCFGQSPTSSGGAPNCASTNSQVTVGLYGGSTTCTFETSVTWGDGATSGPTDYPGQPNNALAAPFVHTYQAVGTYKLAISTSAKSPCSGSEIFNWTFTLESPPVFTADSPTAGTIGTAYSYTFAATGWPKPGYTVTSGSLPPGLSLDPASGELSGVPSASGTFTFQVTASNGVSPDAVTTPLTVTVDSAIAQVAAIRFAPESVTGYLFLRALLSGAPPGLPVIKDDQSTPQYDRDWGPSSCGDGLSDPKVYDYLDCGNPSTSPEKNWPVIYPAGSKLSINSAVFFSQAELVDPELTATATVTNPDTGQSFTGLELAPTSLDSTASSGGYLLTHEGGLLTPDLEFTGTMPPVAGVDQLTITWQITSDGVTYSAGTSTHAVYVTWQANKRPTLGTDLFVDQPYVSVLDIGTRMVTGLGPINSTEKDVISKIWSAFTGLDLPHPVLDPQTGEVSAGPKTLTYYTNGYTTIGDYWTVSSPASNCDRNFLVPKPECTSLFTLLETNSGTCGQWAEFLAVMLGFQGADAGYTKITQPRFNYGPPPAPAKPAIGYAYMLIGTDSLWDFMSPTPSDAPYPYVDSLSVAGGTVNISGTGLSFNQSMVPISQGQNSAPKPMFPTGDHVFVYTSACGILDPSYGKPTSCDPGFKTIQQYEPTAVAGFAVIFELRGHTWMPVPNNISLRQLQSDCTPPGQCQFRATRLLCEASDFTDSAVSLIPTTGQRRVEVRILGPVSPRPRGRHGAYPI